MTALVLENLATLSAPVRSLRILPARMARALDAIVSARAARAVPEWRMREVQAEINRHLGRIRAGVLRQGMQTKCTPTANSGWHSGSRFFSAQVTICDHRAMTQSNSPA